ncbi:low-density lipoprotein receptor-related protein 8-like isoform X2 [Tachysurus vachellii]|uniref:low-density lipoprotein receptor-related protein 8-like isoform X2 n=1 Tax=Tachysurus vachellii TaxID=175792 RepID=UPI00296ABC07|nr:low-density lipoprotein receptor-related protein 8-like isoform X2 [Tachysurus vachellii]
MWTFLGRIICFQLLTMQPYCGKGSETECEDGQFQCKNKRCIPTLWRCDDDDDCSDNSDEEECLKSTCDPAEFACQNGQCVSSRWLCDGEPECSDGSDEAESTCTVKQTCPPDKFDCRGTCVSPAWKCDGEKDCDSGADEEDCAADARSCASGEFQCRNLKCMSPAYVCDGDDDCGDGTDEEQCSPPSCGPLQFRCNSSECIPQPWTCDRDPDCFDGSDEWEGLCGDADGRTLAPAVLRVECGAGMFRCGSGECIKLAWRCDKDPDCVDRSDESDCPLLTCRPDEFQCGDGSCIHGIKQCNKAFDCLDRSDEAGCVNATKCEGPLKFLCRNGECIDGAKVCDDVKDCKDRSDEPKRECGLNECTMNNGGCSHICVDRPIGYECQCPAGYKLLDKRTCGDIDECENPDACSQICINLKGDFKCECHSGYEMDPVSRTCKAEGKSPFLMFTNRHEIRRIDLVKREYTQVVPTQKNAVAIDVDVTSNRMYWCDRFHRKIYSAYIHEASDPAHHMTLIDTDLLSPEGLAFDWVQHNLYWTDSGHGTISVASAVGSRRRVLIRTELSEPRAIAVAPEQGFMFWSDWGTRPKIEKAGMNGVDRQVLVSEGIEWPNGITLDVVGKRLYWVDSKLHLISSVDFNGAQRRVILSSSERLGHPYALAVFEDRVYWTDREKEAVYSANRLTGQDVTSLAERLKDPHDIVVFHQLSQPQAADSCDLAGMTNGGCAFLCLRAPQISAHSPKYTCACPDGEELSPDTRLCVAIQNVTVTPTFPSFPLNSSTVESEAVTEAVTEAGVDTVNSEVSFISEVVTFKENVVQSEPTLNITVASTQIPTVLLSTTTGETTNLSHHSGNELYLLGHSVPVAVLGVGIPIVAFVLLLSASCLIYRNWRLRSTKSMNFDNPVYRKSTGETEEDEIHIGRSEGLATHQHPYPVPAVGTATCPPFIALPLGGAVTDPVPHWYTEPPTITSAK